MIAALDAAHAEAAAPTQNVTRLNKAEVSTT